MHVRYSRFHVGYDETPWLLGDKMQGRHHTGIRVVRSERVDTIPDDLSGLQNPYAEQRSVHIKRARQMIVASVLWRYT